MTSRVQPIGRGEELTLIDRGLGASGRVVLLGEAGIGKTALLRDAIARERGAVFLGGALASLAWMPLLALERALDRDLPVGDAVEVANVVEEEVRDGLLVLEDLHWAHATTLEVLELLTRRTRVLASVRTGDAGAQAAMAAVEVAGFLPVPLTPLDEASARAVVLRANSTLPESEVQHVLARARGNPLLLSQLSGSGMPSDDLSIALRAGLLSLGTDGRRALRVLGLLGRPAEAHLLGPGVEEIVAAGLAECRGELVAVHHDLLAETALAATPPAELEALRVEVGEALSDPGEAARHLAAAGRHALARRRALEAAELAPSATDRAIHLGLAAECTEGADAPAERLRAARALLDTGQYAAALALASRVGGDDSEQRAEAELVRGRSLIGVGDSGVALAAFERGLDLVEGSGADIEVKLRIERVRLPLIYQWDVLTGLVYAEEAHALALATGVETARAAYMLGLAHIVTGQSTWAEHLEAARAGSAAVGESLFEMDVLYSLAVGNLLGGSVEEAERLIGSGKRRCQELRMLGYERSFAALATVAALQAGDYPRVLRDALRLLQVPLDARSRDNVQGVLALAYIDTGQDAEARRQVDAALSTAVHDPIGRDTALLYRCELDLWAGRPREALAGIEDVLREANPTYPFGAFAFLARGWAQLDLDMTPEGIPDVVLALTRVFPLLHGIAPEAAGQQALGKGEDSRAADLFLEATELWRPYLRRSEIRCRWAAGEALRRAGREAAAIAELEHAATLAGQHGAVPLLRRAEQSLRRLGRRTATRTAVAADGLTPRQEEIVLLALDGMTNVEIARRLGINETTVSRTIATVGRKLGAVSRRDTVIRFAELRAGRSA